MLIVSGEWSGRGPASRPAPVVEGEPSQQQQPVVQAGDKGTPAAYPMLLVQNGQAVRLPSLTWSSP